VSLEGVSHEAGTGNEPDENAEGEGSDRRHSRKQRAFPTERVPDLVGAALLFVLGWLLAIALRASILRLGAGIDRMFYVVRDRLGLTQIELRWPISRVLAYTIYWLVIVFFLAAVSEVLDLPGLADIFDRILLYLPLLAVWRWSCSRCTWRAGWPPVR